MLTQYRERLHLKEVERGIQQQNTVGYFSGLKKVVVLLDVTEKQSLIAATNYLKKLKKQAGTIKILAYSDTKEPIDTLPFESFCKKDLDWIWRPKKEVSEQFKSENFDLLINFCQEDCFPLEFLAVSIDANYKIGALTNYPNNYDLMVEAKSLDKYFDQVTFFISKFTDG